MSRYFEFSSYTDDTAPDYDGKVAAVIIALSLVPALATVGVAAGFDLLAGDFVDAVWYVSVGGTQAGALVLFPLVGLLLATVVRRAAVPVVDTGEWHRTAPLVGALAVLSGLFLGTVLELLGTTTPVTYLVVGGAIVLLVLFVNALVLGTGFDFAWAGTVATGVAVVAAAVLLALPIVWWFSTDGVFWSLYQTLVWVFFQVLLPLVFLTSYWYDAWRNAEAGMTPAVNAMAGFVSLVTVAPVALERVVVRLGTVLKALGEDSGSSA